MSNKGTPFEREICKRLSLWWTNDERDDVFWRTSQSGGRATTRSKRGRATANQYGDVCAVDPIGQPLIDVLTIELKRGYNRDTVHDLLDRPAKAAKQQYEKWIEKAEADAEAAGSFSWMIIHRRDRREPLVWMHDDLSNELRSEGIYIPERIRYLRYRKEDKASIWIWGASFEDWLYHVKPSDIKQIAKEWKGEP